MALSFNTTILGGLPVTIGYCIESADPEVGIPGGAVEDWWIEAVNGKACKNTPIWLMKRINDTYEEESIDEKCGLHYYSLSH